MSDVFSLPQGKAIIKWLGESMQLAGIRKVVYPSHFVPSIVRPVYWLLGKTGFLSIVPLGHLYVFKKVP